MSIIQQAIQTNGGVAASITIAAPGAGRRIMLRGLSGAYMDSAAPIASTLLSVVSNAVTFWNLRPRTAAANEQWRVESLNFRLIADANQAMTISFSGQTATGFQEISVWGRVI